MGRRSRKRATQASPREAPPTTPRRTTPQRPAARGQRGDAPSAPWGAFPLVELCVLLALGLGVAGVLTGGRQGLILLACAMSVGSLAGLEVSIREHLAGFRSHTTVLAGSGAVLAAAVLFFASAPFIAIFAAAVVVFSLCFWRFRELFRRRSGGLTVR